MTHNTTPNSQGIDTIRVIGNYATTLKMVESMGLSVEVPNKNSPISQTVTNLLKIEEYDPNKIRYKKEKFRPCVEVVKLSKGKSVSNYMIITKNIPLLFDHALKHKVKKDNFCLITFTGLHQPNKIVKSEATKLMKLFLKRKTYKLQSIDIAIDHQSKEPINKEGLKLFKERLEPFSRHGVTMPPNKATSYYINQVEHFRVSRILYYDKYLKAKQQKEKIPTAWKHWKRLEITLTFDAMSKDNRGFIEYLKLIELNEILSLLKDIANKAKLKKISHDFLEYQLSSFIDNRFMNNRDSKKQFNSLEALERYKISHFRRYVLIV